MILYGASGHGKVIKEIVEDNDGIVEAFVDDNFAIKEFSGLPVLHEVDDSKKVIISIGVNATRKRIVEKQNCHFGVAIHSSAIVSPSVEIGEGSVVMAGAIINAGVKIGKHCIVNTGASIDHECVIGDYVHIAPHATLCGQVHVGEGSLVGVGASVIPCIHIGDWSIIGAGAAVINNIDNNMKVGGVPAKPLGLNCTQEIS